MSICSPSRRDPLQERREQIAQAAKRFISIIRRTRAREPEPDPAVQIIIERTRERLDQIHRTGQRYLPEAPSDTAISRVIQIRRSDDVPAR